MHAARAVDGILDFPAHILFCTDRLSFFPDTWNGLWSGRVDISKRRQTGQDSLPEQMPLLDGTTLFTFTILDGNNPQLGEILF